MIQTVRVNKSRTWMIWSTWNWSRILMYTALCCLIAYVVCLLQMNIVVSQVKEIEQQSITLQREATQIQSDIYALTRDTSFLELSSSHAMALHEPQDDTILYMQLPPTSLVMR